MELLLLFNFVISQLLNLNAMHVTIFNCWTIQDKVDVFKMFTQNLISVNFVDTTDRQTAQENVKEICGRHYTPVDGIILDYDCANSQDIVWRANLSSCFTAVHAWLIFSHERKFPDFVTQFRDVNLNIDTQLTYANVTQNESSRELAISVYDVYNNGKRRGGKLNMTLDRTIICNCNSKLCKTKLTDLSLRSKYGNRCSMTDLTMVISTVVTGIPMNQSDEAIIRHLDSINNTHIETFSRMAYKLIVHFQEIYGYNLSYIHNSFWTRNETSGGAMGDLSEGRADQTTTVLLTQRVVYNLRCTIEFNAFGSIFFFRTPQNEGIAGSVFFKPFTNSVWLLYGLTILVFCVVLKLVFYIERRTGSKFFYVPSWLTTFMCSLGSACQQGSPVEPSSAGGKIVLLSSLLTFFMLYNYYTSIVVSSLLGSPVKSKVKNLRQLADSNLNIGLEDTPYTRAYLRVMGGDVQYFTEKKVIPQLSQIWLSPEEGAKKVREGGYAYHSVITTFYHIIRSTYEPAEICDLNQVRLRPETQLGILISRFSPYVEISKIKFTWMAETGLAVKHRRYWVKKTLPCFSSASVISVGLEYTAGLFILLVCGYALALTILIFENIYARYCSQNT